MGGLELVGHGCVALHQPLCLVLHKRLCVKRLCVVLGDDAAHVGGEHGGGVLEDVAGEGQLG